MPAIGRDYALVCDCSVIDDGEDRSIFVLSAWPDDLCLRAVFILLQRLAPGMSEALKLLKRGAAILNKIAASQRMAAAYTPGVMPKRRTKAR